MTNRFFQRAKLTPPQNSYTSSFLFEVNNERFRKFNSEFEAALLELESNHNCDSQTSVRCDSVLPNLAGTNSALANTLQVKELNSTTDEFDFPVDARWI